MRQRPLQIAILGGTTALVIFLSLLATTPLLYRHLAFAPSEQGPAPTADEPLDLQNMSTYQLLATSARILAPATAPPTFRMSSTAAEAVPPVARRSSIMTIRCPGSIASAWILIVSLPYSTGAPIAWQMLWLRCHLQMAKPHLQL